MDPGQILLERGLLDAEGIERASSALNNGERVDQAAVELGLVTEEDALRALGEEVGMAFY